MDETTLLACFWHLCDYRNRKKSKNSKNHPLSPRTQRENRSEFITGGFFGDFCGRVDRQVKIPDAPQKQVATTYVKDDLRNWFNYWLS
jgi:hypothetical protein